MTVLSRLMLMAMLMLNVAWLSPAFAQDASVETQVLPLPEEPGDDEPDPQPVPAFVPLPAGEPDDEPRNIFKQAQARAQARCVKLYGAGIANEEAYGTGILVSDDGLILTAATILTANESLRVMTPDGEVHYAKQVRRSEPLQLMLLKIDAATPDYFVVDDEPVAATGDWVLAVSNAFKIADRGEQLSVNLGVVSLRTKLDVKKRMQDVTYEGDALIVDAITSNPGAAGGAMVTLDGRLAGMVGKIIESKEIGTRLNYAVPNDQLRLFLDDKPLIADTGDDEPKGKPYTGIKVFVLGGERAPAYIDRIMPGSPASLAGLKRDDLILTLDGEVVRSVEHYQELEPTLAPDKPITVIVKRRSELVTVTLKPRELPRDDDE